MKNEIRIFAQRSDKPAHYLQVIEIAYQVLKNRNTNKVIVDFHPVITLPNLNLAKKLLIKHSKQNNTVRRVNEEGIIYKLLRSGNVNIKTDEGLVSLKIKNRLIKPSLYSYIKYSILSYHINNKYSPYNIYSVSRLSHKNIHYGLRVLSHCMRYSDDSNGKIESIKNIQYEVFRALNIINYTFKASKKSKYDYSCIMEKYYLFGLFADTLDAVGVQRLEFDGERGRLLPIEPSEEDYKSYMSEIKEYISLRTNNPSMMMVDNKKSMKTRHNIKCEPNDNIVVIYLHSFVDAMYRHGYDGFNDMYEWLEFTVNTLIKNTHNQIFIKDHPDGKRHEKHTNLVNELREIYSSITRVKWLPTDVSVYSFEGVNNYIGITHHGTVSEEHAILDLPVVDSVYSHRGYEYRLGFTWKSIKDYEKILLNLDKYITKKSDKERQKRLHKYIYIKYIINKNKTRIYLADSISEKKCLSLNQSELSELLEKSCVII